MMMRAKSLPITGHPLLIHIRRRADDRPAIRLNESIALLNLEKDNPLPWSSLSMHLQSHPILRAFAWLSAVVIIAGCSSSDSRARAALGEYQTASAANDLPAARRALLELVQAKDDVAEYWAELGKVQTA